MKAHGDYLTSAAQTALVALGENIRTARLRRRMTMQLLAERAGISLPTLRRLEKGDGGVSLTVMANVLTGLDLEDTIDRMADPLQDLLGIAMERAQRKQRGRAVGVEDELDADF